MHKWTLWCKRTSKIHSLLSLNIFYSEIMTLPQLAFYENLHRAVIGPSATLTGRWRTDIDLRWMLTGSIQITTYKILGLERKQIAYEVPKKKYAIIRRKSWKKCHETELLFRTTIHIRWRAQVYNTRMSRMKTAQV